MKRKSRQSGFSLLETLLAVSTLAVGMIFVGGTFLAGIYFATLSTERTIATVAAGEAFAKIRLYGLDPEAVDPNGFVPYEELVTIPSSELLYPSVDANSVLVREYSWAALCKRQDANSRLVEVTVFVTRRTGLNARFWARDAETDELEEVELPCPVRVTVAHDTDDDENELTIEDVVTSDNTKEETFINAGATIVDDRTGEIYRVLERYADPSDRIRLDRPWTGGAASASEGDGVWVVPRPVSGGRSPQVAVYQEVLRF